MIEKKKLSEMSDDERKEQIEKFKTASNEDKEIMYYQFKSILENENISDQNREFLESLRNDFENADFFENGEDILLDDEPISDEEKERYLQEIQLDVFTEQIRKKIGESLPEEVEKAFRDINLLDSLAQQNAAAQGLAIILISFFDGKDLEFLKFAYYEYKLRTAVNKREQQQFARQLRLAAGFAIEKYAPDENKRNSLACDDCGKTNDDFENWTFETEIKKRCEECSYKELEFWQNFAADVRKSPPKKKLGLNFKPKRETEED